MVQDITHIQDRGFALGLSAKRIASQTLPYLELPGGGSPCWKTLERYEWTDGLALVSHGARLGIRVTDSAVMDQVRVHLPPGWTEAASPVVDSLLSLVVVESKSRTRREPHFFVYLGSCRMGHGRSLEAVLPALESLLHAQVAAQARERLFVHAGAVAWHGRAIVIPGRSFSGKTSLVAALVRAGAEYLSDEYAVFDTDGQVHPYAKPLSLRGTEGNANVRCSAESLGGAVSAGPVPVGLIAVTRYEEGAHWRPRMMAPAAALLSLLDNTVQVREQPALSLSTLRPVVLAAQAVKSKRGEADRVAAWLLAQLPG